jgi:DNA-binding HxlR family transcriptional regulator
MIKTSELTGACRKKIQAVRDTQDLLSGKWKTSILGALFFNGALRFMDLSRHLEHIAPKVLSRELKDLEMNRLIKRTVKDTMPVTVEYELTAQGRSLQGVIEAMGEWGKTYRHSLFNE